MKRNSIILVCLTLLCLLSAVPCLAGSGGLSSEAEKAALKALDIAECKNLMGWHVWYHGAFLNDIEVEKIWVTTPEYQETAVWAQNAQYWIGMDNIKAYYGPTTSQEAKKSGFQFHATTTAVVEIAEDRQTAKGVWYTPGAIGTADSLQGMWERYGIDFVRENGEWKIWHLHVYTDFSFSLSSGGAAGGMGGGRGGMTEGMGQRGAFDPNAMGERGMPPGMGEDQGAAQGMRGQAGTAQDMGERGGAERFGMEGGAPGMGGGRGPNVPSQATANPGYSELSANTYADLIPRPPEPYRTFSETWSYGDPDEVKMFSGEYKDWSEIKALYNK